MGLPDSEEARQEWVCWYTETKSVFLLQLDASVCAHMQFAEENVPGFHQILRGASGPRVIKDPLLLYFNLRKWCFFLIKIEYSI